MKQTRSENKYAFLFPVGLSIGIVVGVSIHNIGAGLAIGAGIGTILSLIAWQFSRQNE